MPEVFAFADNLVTEMADRDSMLALELGLPVSDLPNFSIGFQIENLNFFRAKLTQLDNLDARNPQDEVAIKVMRERLQTWIDSLEAEDYLSDLNNLASPLQSVRAFFDLFQVENEADQGKWVEFVSQIPSCLAAYRETLEIGLDRGNSASARQAKTAAEQCAAFGEYFIETARSYGRGSDEAEIAALAFEQIGDWLANEYATRTKANEAVGAQRYIREIRRWTGAELDPYELHEWGWQELARINSRMQEVAEKIAPGTHYSALPELLESKSEYLINGESEILAFLRKLTDHAITELKDRHFIIDPKIEFCDIKIAPAGSASAPYYMPPSEDLSRPGTTYLPTLGSDSFSTWHLVSTWYHEAVPGHHLQMATTMLEVENLSRFQRTVGWTSGYAEGWALYAERLMDELGYFADPGYELGFLAAQALRAARIVVDTGMHLELKVPAGVDSIAGTPIDYDFSVDLLQQKALQSEAVAISETIRYLGLPGQAVSYKVGERMILELREIATSRMDFDLPDWHRKLLAIGPVGLDVLKELMA